MAGQRLHVLLLVIALLGGACTARDAQPADDGGTVPSAPPPRSDVGATMDAAGHDAFEARVARADELTVELAAQGFGRAFGPVEGLTSQVADRAGGPMAAHVALTRIGAVLDELTDAQRDAITDRLGEMLDRTIVRRRLAPDADAFVDLPVEVAAGGGTGAQVAKVAAMALAAEEGDAQQDRIRAVFEPLILEARDVLSSAMGLTYDGDIDLRILTSDRVDVEGAWSSSSDYLGDLGLALVDCEIIVGRFPDGRDPAVARAIVYHEVFHCVQRRLGPSEPARADRPMWVSEGTAAWVGEHAAGGTELSRAWWQGYLGHPAYRPSNPGAYSAIGFVDHAIEVAGDPWMLLQDVFRAPVQGGPDDYVDLVMGEPASFLRGYGPSRLVERTWGGIWSGDGPGMPSSPLSVADLLGADAGALPYGGTRLFARSAPAPGELLVVRARAAEGAMRWQPLGADGSEVTVTGATFEHAWCARGTCTCPDGSVVPGHAPRPVPDGAENLVVGVASVRGGGSVETDIVHLDDVCIPECPPGGGGTAMRMVSAPVSCDPPPGPGCVVGTWGVDLGGVAAQIERLLASEGPGETSPTADPAGGTIRAVYREDGTVTTTYDQVRLSLVQPAGEIVVPVVVTIDGAGDARYRVEGDRIVVDASTVDISAGVAIAGQPVPGGIGLDTADFTGVVGTADVDCAGDVMVQTVDVGDGDVLRHVFTRR